MKKILGIISLSLFFSGTSLNADSNFKKPTQNDPIDVITCAEFAGTMGLLAAGNGGSYYEAYFVAYGHCIENLDPL